VAASILGAARFKSQAVRVSLWVLTGTACVAVLSPIYLLSHDVRALRSSLVSAKEHAVSLIPPAVAVSASHELGGHLSERRYSYTFPHVLQSRWIIVDANDPTYGDRTPGYKRYIHKYERDKSWRIVFSSQGVTVLHRRRATSK
jgi:hypothetical protein